MIDENMISEATILRFYFLGFAFLICTLLSIRQIPKNYFEHNFVEELRNHGVKGSRDGHRGKPTYFYKVVNWDLFFGV